MQPLKMRTGYDPKQQRYVLAFCRRRMKAGKGFPEIDEIRRYMGWQTRQAVSDCLGRLEAKGMVRGWKGPGQSGTTWELVPTPGKRILAP